MRVLHFADLHLGVENYNKDTNPENGFSYCFGDFLATLDEVVDFALHSDVDLVLFCGDAYKSRNPSQTQQREFARRIARLASRLPVFLLTGNHDLPSARGQANTVEIFDTLAVSNVTIADRLQTYCVKTRSGPLQIVALPWARKHFLLDKEEGKDLTLEELNRRVEEKLTNGLAREAQRLDPGIPAILAAHIFLQGAEFGAEKTMGIGKDPALLQSSVALPAFRYGALGHIHKRQVFDREPLLAYPGSLQRLDFSDEEQEKGFYLVEIDHQKTSTAKFHPVKARRFFTLKLHILPHDTNPTATILRSLAQREKEIKGAIVRLHLLLTEHSEGVVQETEIRKAMREAQFFDLVREIERQHRPRLGSAPLERLTPLQALQSYLEWKKVPSERRQKLIEYGEKLIIKGETKEEKEEAPCP